MAKNYIINGQARGTVATTLLENNFDTDSLRPYRGDRGGEFITRYVTNKFGKRVPKAIPVTNANASLLVREWIDLDKVVIKAALPRLRAVADVRSRGLVMNIPNGMSKTVLQSQAQSDISGANVSMDGLADSAGDAPVYNLTNLPLPIIHKDFSFSAREVAVSRNGSMPLDMTGAELAARRVAEGVEQLMIGTAGSYSFGGGSIYGFTNFPGRMTYSLDDPTDPSWTPRDTLLNVLGMRTASQQHKHYGPWVLYVSLAWDQYMDDDFSTYKGSKTLRDRLREVEGIDDVVTLDYLVGYDMVLVQMTTNVVRTVVGMDITTVQWESHGGMKLNFKVMAIIIPQLRSDFNSNTGIVHGSVSGATTGPTGVPPFSLQNP